MTDERLSTSALDDILSRAVDRQIAEQRALRQSLDELRESVAELAAKPGPRVDVSALEDRLQTIVRALSERPAGGGVDVVGLEERLKGLIQSTVMGASETTFSSLSDQLRSFRESVVPRLDAAGEANAGVRDLSAEIAQVRDVVGSVSGDLEGIAQALIDFNTGIRQWATGMDDGIASIRLTVGELYAVSTQPTKTREPEKESKPELPPDEEPEPRKRKEPAPEPDTRRSAEIADRIKETAELSEYLADQIEDLDGVMGRLSELPHQLEGVVSQALKRTLTARAKLDKEAEGALDEVLEALDQQVGALGEVLSRFEQEEDHMRKLALEQVELSSRIESLQETFIDRIERFDTDRRRSEEAIAVAIDRSARGLQPRALESLSKSTKRKPPAPKAQKTRTAKAAPKAPEPKPEPARKPKRSRRRSKELDWTPLPSDE